MTIFVEIQSVKHTSFADILTSLSSENHDFSTENDTIFYESIQDPSPLLGDFYQSRTPSAQYKKSLYFSNPSKKPKATLAQPHALTARELAALERFNVILNTMEPEGLSLNFTIQQLKSAFRRGVKSIHPDHGGSADLFSDFFLSYKILLDFFKPIK